MRTNGDEIGPGLRIIISFQPDRTTVVDGGIVGHRFNFTCDPDGAQILVGVGSNDVEFCPIRIETHPGLPKPNLPRGLQHAPISIREMDSSTETAQFG